MKITKIIVSNSFALTFKEREGEKGQVRRVFFAAVEMSK